jgi:hypothetical protein
MNGILRDFKAFVFIFYDLSKEETPPLIEG